VIRAFLVDLGNVLVRFDHLKTVRRIAEFTGLPPERLAPSLFGDLEAALDQGDLSPEAFFRAAEDRCSLPRIPDEVWIPAWRDIFEPVPEALDALRAIPRSTVKILVSNTNSLHWEGVLKVAPIDQLVDGLALSFRERARKPDSRIFEAALEMARALPREALYADDRSDFIEAARNLGIEGFVVDRPETLRVELASRGVLANGNRDPNVDC
jgi:putative hydrolase of the HAD superfamily